MRFLLSAIFIFISLEVSANKLPLPLKDTDYRFVDVNEAKLGQLLFYDPILSGNKEVACATCHHPDKGWGDNLNRSIGVGGIGLGENRIGSIAVKRNAHTIINSAFNGIDVNGNYNPSNTVMFWDNRVVSLEEQSLVPIKSMEEMRGNISVSYTHLTLPTSDLV